MVAKRANKGLKIQMKNGEELYRSEIWNLRTLQKRTCFDPAEQLLRYAKNIVVIVFTYNLLA